MSSYQQEVLQSILRKHAKSDVFSVRKYYRVSLIIQENGIPIIEYQHSKKPKKYIKFSDLLFADIKHDTNEIAFSIYTIDKTITFFAPDESTRNDWLTKIREFYADLYPDYKLYNAIFEASLLDKGLAKTMNIQGFYRLALSKESLDLIPVITAQQQLQQMPQLPVTTTTATTTTPVTNNNNNHKHHHHSAIKSANHHHQRFQLRHPLLSAKTIELMLRSIRRCGHTDCNFYIESGRHSQIGEGDLWMALKKKSTARQLHELLLESMKTASEIDNQFLYKAPRSRGSSTASQLTQALPSILNNNEVDNGYVPMA